MLMHSNTIGLYNGSDDVTFDKIISVHPLMDLSIKDLPAPLKMLDALFVEYLDPYLNTMSINTKNKHGDYSSQGWHISLKTTEHLEPESFEVNLKEAMENKYFLMGLYQDPSLNTALWNAYTGAYETAATGSEKDLFRTIDKDKSRVPMDQYNSPFFHTMIDQQQTCVIIKMLPISFKYSGNVSTALTGTQALLWTAAHLKFCEFQIDQGVNPQLFQSEYNHWLIRLITFFTNYISLNFQLTVHKVVR